MPQVLRLRALPFAAAAALFVVVPHRARALGEEEWRAAAGLGPAVLWAEDGRGVGLDLELEGARGLTDLLAVRGGLALGHGGLAAGRGVPGDGDDGAPALGLTLGLGLALDVLTFVPFVDAGLAARYFGQAGPAHGLRLGVELGTGGDYLLDRHWSLGLVVRGAWLPLGLSHAEQPSALSARAAVRASYVFD